MKIIYVIIILLLLLPDLQASFNSYDIAARNVGTGIASSTYNETADNIYYNPAAILNAATKAISVNYVNLNNLNLIHYGYLGFTFPIDNTAGAGIGIKLYGTTSRVKTIDYTERTIYLSYAFNTIKNINCGLTFQYMQAQYSLSESYIIAGKGSGAGLNFGSIFKIHYNLRASLVIENIISPKIRWYDGSSEDKKPDIKIGLAYYLADFLFLAQADKILIEEPQFGLGINYNVIEQLTLRVNGYNQYGTEITFAGGLTVNFGNPVLDYTYQLHYSLPGTHYFSINILF